MARLTNQLKHMAVLRRIVPDVDEHDRPVLKRVDVRMLYYTGLGVYATEKYLSQQAKTDVSKRIGIRQDDRITEKDFGVQIAGIDYNIERIYVNEARREMELSLSLVQ